MPLLYRHFKSGLLCRILVRKKGLAPYKFYNKYPYIKKHILLLRQSVIQAVSGQLPISATRVHSQVWSSPANCHFTNCCTSVIRRYKVSILTASLNNQLKNILKSHTMMCDVSGDIIFLRYVSCNSDLFEWTWYASTIQSVMQSVKPPVDGTFYCSL
jgi:hypothetical protein